MLRRSLLRELDLFRGPKKCRRSPPAKQLRLRSAGYIRPAYFAPTVTSGRELSLVQAQIEIPKAQRLTSFIDRCEQSRWSESGGIREFGREPAECAHTDRSGVRWELRRPFLQKRIAGVASRRSSAVARNRFLFCFGFASWARSAGAPRAQHERLRLGRSDSQVGSHGHECPCYGLGRCRPWLPTSAWATATGSARPVAATGAIASVGTGTTSAVA